MNTNWRGKRQGRALLIAATVAAAACSRANASRETALSGSPVLAQSPAQTTLEIAERDCAMSRARSGSGGILGEVGAVSLDRVPVHSAAVGHTSSAWRLAVASQQGPGAIVVVELPRGDCYVGQGLFAGWTRSQLASAYLRLKPRPDPEPDDFQQLE